MRMSIQKDKQLQLHGLVHPRKPAYQCLHIQNTKASTCFSFTSSSTHFDRVDANL
jgi:hypothetical protein